MDGKFHGTIQSITLDDASYQGTGETIEPTYINYFFGNNGSGKSTLARAIQTGTGVTYSPGKTAQDCLPLVFNQEYIDANMRSYRNLPGVFTVNKVNVDIERQIEGKQSELDAIKAELDDARDNKGKKEKGRILQSGFKMTAGTRQKTSANDSTAPRKERKRRKRSSVSSSSTPRRSKTWTP